MSDFPISFFCYNRKRSSIILHGHMVTESNVFQNNKQNSGLVFTALINVIIFFLFGIIS